MYEDYFLNTCKTYKSIANRTREDNEALIWDCEATTVVRRTHCAKSRFEEIFANTMSYILTTEHHMYQDIQRGDFSEAKFIQWLQVYFRRNVPEMSNEADYRLMYARLYTAIYGYYVLQPLIDNPDTSDIKICGPKDIRVRVKGKAYKSSQVFLDEQDLYCFVEGLAIRNNLAFKKPVISFTDNHDKNYILRFVISAPMINAVTYPYLHIRKVNKTKPTFDDLIEAGMLTPIVKDYLIDKAKLSRGIVFAGPPGSGKTTALNAFIEFIPKTRETLVIQENDELFTNQSGFMFKHVTHGFQGEPIYTLEDLGKMALVEGCNEFIIGEVKGGEMRNIMTLLNAGGYSAFTVHSTNAYETMDKLADLVKYGSDYSFDEARRMLRVMDTIVYMENYQIQEILELVDYDMEKKEFVYRKVYKNEHPRDVSDKIVDIQEIADKNHGLSEEERILEQLKADSAFKNRILQSKENGKMLRQGQALMQGEEMYKKPNLSDASGTSSE